jgi:NhaA family Na+:H+ antiporter
VANKTPARSRANTEALAEKSFLARSLGLASLRFVHTAEVGGAVLLLAALIALAWANSPWKQSYHDLFHTPIVLKIGNFDLAVPDSPAEGHDEAPASGAAEGHGGPAEGMTLHHWINDGLMVIFFFIVGLEIKHELVEGQLAGVKRATFPVVLALGGMVAPALIYLALNLGGKGANGWGVPMATDIAFAVATLALLGKRVGATLRILLLAFAIADDLGAIAVIAIFYTESISWVALGVAAGLFLLVLLMQRLGVLDIAPYIFVGVLLWAAMLASGIHATIAGVVLGLLTPTMPFFPIRKYRQEFSALEQEFQKALDEGRDDDAEYHLGRIERLTLGTEPVLDRLIRLVHPWSAFVVLPIFALANAGVAINSAALSAAAGSPITWGIMLGLVVGKPLGITGFAWLATRIGLVSLPEGVTFRHLIGLGLLGGIGFTVALFITDLAFSDPALIEQAKIGILAASFVSAVVGYLYLLRAMRLAPEPAPTPS